jgi:hypothetical protein
LSGKCFVSSNSGLPWHWPQSRGITWTNAGRRLRRIRQKSVGPRCSRRDSIAGNDFGSLVTCPSLAVASCFCDFLASAAFLLKNRRDAIFCKVSRKKATHLEKEPEQNVSEQRDD